MKLLRQRQSLPGQLSAAVDPPYRVIAVHGYSSSHEDDLNFAARQIILVQADLDADWFFGEYSTDSGKHNSGIFPKSFVKTYHPNKLLKMPRREPIRPSTRPKRPTEHPDGGKLNFLRKRISAIEDIRRRSPDGVQNRNSATSSNSPATLSQPRSDGERAPLRDTEAKKPEEGHTHTMKPIYLKGLFSVSCTSSMPLSFIQAEIIRVVDKLDITRREIPGGYSCHPESARDLSDLIPTRPGDSLVGWYDWFICFEILIVKVPLLQLHGIQFKNLGDGVWLYKRTAEYILTELRI